MRDCVLRFVRRGPAVHAQVACDLQVVAGGGAAVAPQAVASHFICRLPLPTLLTSSSPPAPPVAARSCAAEVCALGWASVHLYGRAVGGRVGSCPVAFASAAVVPPTVLRCPAAVLRCPARADGCCKHVCCC